MQLIARAEGNSGSLSVYRCRSGFVEVVKRIGVDGHELLEVVQHGPHMHEPLVKYVERAQQDIAAAIHAQAAQASAMMSMPSRPVGDGQRRARR
jgi:hypothetical protein